MREKDLDIRLVDFGNAADANNFAKRIFLAANNLDLFVSRRCCTQEEREVKAIAKEWICRVEEAIDNMSAGDALTVISSFDIIHRIGYNIPANQSYVDKYKLGAFEAYIRGDKSVDQYILYDAISEEIRRRNKAYFDRPLDWQSLCLDRWHKNFRTGKSAIPQSDYDTIHQITALLNADLWAFDPEQTAFKHRLMANHRNYLNETGKLNSIISTILR